MPQAFKQNDALEAKMASVPDFAFDLIGEAQDQFFAGGETCSAFLLSLYDAGRLNFSDRIGRDHFISFFKKLIENTETLGTFETILSILKEIFGQDAEITFEVPAAGKLEINIASYEDLLFDLVGTEDGEEFFIAGDGDDTIITSEVVGFETEQELKNLFAEIVLAGVFCTPTINFYERFFFVAD